MAGSVLGKKEGTLGARGKSRASLSRNETKHHDLRVLSASMSSEP